MIFPKGQPVHENLNTSFTQFDAMLADLKSNHFTGYMRVTAWEYEGILLFDTGNVVNAIDETRGERRNGPGAAETIAAKAREKDGAISVYRLSDEMAQVLAGLFNGEPVYKDLASDFTSLDKLIAKLREEKHTGYVEVRLAKSQDAAIIFMRDGETVESIFSNKGNVLSGPEVLAQVIQATANAGALFTVYRTDLARAYHRGTNLADGFARQEVFSLWQDILGKVQAVTDGPASPDKFVVAFKRARAARADEFPFLDPFVAEFEYRTGQIKFDGRATLNELSQGLSSCLAQALHDLAAEDRDLIRRLKPAAEEMKAKHNGRLAEMGLAAALPELFGS